MLKRALIVGFALVLLVPTATGAVYRDTRSDPNDVPTPNDLRSTTRRVVQVDGRRILRIVLLGYQRWPQFPDDSFRATIKLDVRGGPRSDEKLGLVTGQDQICFLHPDVLLGPLGLRGDRAVCRVPMRDLRPDKRIRWKVITDYGAGNHPDRAPNDRGWFG